MSVEVPGFAVAVHRSLTEPMLVAGVPPKVAVCLGMTAAVFVGAWHIYAFLPVVMVAYVVALAVCKRDPYAFEIIVHNRGRGSYLP